MRFACLRDLRASHMRACFRNCRAVSSPTRYRIGLPGHGSCRQRPKPRDTRCNRAYEDWEQLPREHGMNHRMTQMKGPDHTRESLDPREIDGIRPTDRRGRPRSRHLVATRLRLLGSIDSLTSGTGHLEAEPCAKVKRIVEEAQRTTEVLAGMLTFARSEVAECTCLEEAIREREQRLRSL